MTETAFSFVPRAARTSKPRKIGLTEIRGPYYSAYGARHLAPGLCQFFTVTNDLHGRAASVNLWTGRRLHSRRGKDQA